MKILKCKICGEQGKFDSQIKSVYSGLDFLIYRCDECVFGWIANPNTDFERLYDEKYYNGEGADPHVTYSVERNHSSGNYVKKIKELEYHGLYKTINLLSIDNRLNPHLDFGGGLGGLVNFFGDHGMVSELYEYGYAKEVAEKLGVPTCTTLVPGTYELVTAIEVLEHMLDPVSTLSNLCSTIRIGGYLVVTTGNLSKHRGKIADWSYVKTNPDVHISFFSPIALHKILKEMGFERVPRKFHRDLILSKILKNILIVINSRSETFYSKYLYKIRFFLIWLVPILDQVKGVSEIGMWKKVEEQCEINPPTFQLE
jgi:hypothetical protein